MATDRELLARYAASGDADAFRELANRHGGMVYGVCLRILADAHTAEDAGQAVFLLLARKAKSLSSATVVSGWLYRTAELTARELRRKAALRSRREKEAGAMQTAQRGEPSSAEAWDAMAPQLDELLRNLPAAQREALLLRYVAGRSETETAAELGCPVGTASARVSRALASLRDALARRGAVLSVGVLATALTEHAAAGAPAQFVSSIQSACLGTSASTMAVQIMEETMRIMFWAKIKMAAVTAAIVIAAGAAVPTAMHFVAAEENAGVASKDGPDTPKPNADKDAAKAKPAEVKGGEIVDNLKVALVAEKTECGPGGPLKFAATVVNCGTEPRKLLSHPFARVRLHVTGPDGKEIEEIEDPRVPRVSYAAPTAKNAKPLEAGKSVEFAETLQWTPFNPPFEDKNIFGKVMRTYPGCGFDIRRPGKYTVTAVYSSGYYGTELHKEDAAIWAGKATSNAVTITVRAPDQF